MPKWWATSWRKIVILLPNGALLPRTRPRYPRVEPEQPGGARVHKLSRCGLVFDHNRHRVELVAEEGR